MEEKERYIIARFDGDIFDTKKEYYPSNQTICEIINQQDKEIKKLEAEAKQLKQQLAEKDEELWEWSTQYAGAYVHRQNALIAEKVELQQQLAEKDKEITSLKINNCCCQMNSKLDSVAQSAAIGIANLNNIVSNITKIVVPKTAICPEVMPRYNSWTAPTSTETA